MADALPCPHCQKTDPEEIKFTWWGGVLGPKMFHHVRCLQCGKTYNLKTGKSNDVAIMIYTVVGLILGIGIMLLLIMGGAFRH